MIFLGNGERSGAKCWGLVADLVSLLIDLSGLQQPFHADTAEGAAWMKECEKRDRRKWDERAEGFLQEVAEALGYEAKLTQIKE